MCSGHEVLMEVDDIIALIVGDLYGILGEQLMPHSIHLLKKYYFYHINY
jgi:hypothetical protein